MLKYFFLNNLFIFQLLAMDSSTLHQPSQQQLQQQILLPPQHNLKNQETLINQFYDLFLDDFTKLMKDGNGEKAKELAEKEEKAYLEIINKRFDKNKSFAYEKYRESQQRKTIDPKERYGVNYFRLYATDPKILIKQHQERIEKLEESIEEREKQLDDLLEKEEKSPKLREILLSEIQKDFEDIQNKFQPLLSEPALKKYPPFKEFKGIADILETLYQDIKKGQNIENIEEKISYVRNILDKVLSYLSIEKEKISKVQNYFNNFLHQLSLLNSFAEGDMETYTKERLRQDLKISYKKFQDESTLWLQKETINCYPTAAKMLEDLQEKVRTLYNNAMSLDVKSTIDDNSNVYGEMNTIVSKIIDNIAGGYYYISQFYSQPLWLLDKISIWSQTEPNETLSSFDRNELEQLRENNKDFIKDTNKQIAKEKERIAFIENHKDFFQIKKRFRSEILGITMPEYWGGNYASIKLGDDVIVGVIDYFPQKEQNFKFLSHAINPKHQGGSGFQGIDKPESPDHGAHVAGIIAGDLWINQEMNDITIGIAPHAMFEIMHVTDLTSKKPETQKGETQENIKHRSQAIWSVDRMAQAITELIKKGHVNDLVQSGDIPFIDLSLNHLTNNKVVNSPAQILNLSLTFGNFGRFSRTPISSFEGEDFVPVLVKALQTRLGVFIIGNDGMDLSSSNQGRLIKALAVSTATAPHMLVVTNLMQDGITLNPNSNTPGKDHYLQNRTLSAPGTGIMSSIQRLNLDDPAYKEMSGTSMAAPHVAGVAAVVLSNHKKLSPAQLSECLLKGATPILIDQNGNPYEIEGISSGEIEEALEKVDFGPVEINGQEVIIEDWFRGKQLYGMGRLNLEGALLYAEQQDPNKTLQKYYDGDLT